MPTVWYPSRLVMHHCLISKELPFLLICTEMPLRGRSQIDSLWLSQTNHFHSSFFINLIQTLQKTFSSSADDRRMALIGGQNYRVVFFNYVSPNDILISAELPPLGHRHGLNKCPNNGGYGRESNWYCNTFGSWQKACKLVKRCKLFKPVSEFLPRKLSINSSVL